MAEDITTVYQGNAVLTGSPTMTNTNEFLINNETDADFDVYVEPECLLVRLKPGDSLRVRERYSKAPMTVQIGQDGSGRHVLSLWPGDGSDRIEHNGVDVRSI